MRIIRNKVLFALVLLMRATPWLGFVTHVRNPLLPGQSVSLAESTNAATRAGVGVLVAVLLVCVWLPQRGASWRLQCAASLGLLPLLLFAAGQAAAHLAAGAPPAARTMPGAGFWWIFSLAALAAADALRRLHAAWLGAACVAAAACAALAWSGALHALRLS